MFKLYLIFLSLLHYIFVYQLISIGNIWPAYPNSLGYFKYFSGCIVCISNGSLNLIWFSLAHVILYSCNSCPCFYVLVWNKIHLFRTLLENLLSVIVTHSNDLLMFPDTPAQVWYLQWTQLTISMWCSSNLLTAW